MRDRGVNLKGDLKVITANESGGFLPALAFLCCFILHQEIRELFFVKTPEINHVKFA